VLPHLGLASDADDALYGRIGKVARRHPERALALLAALERDRRQAGDVRGAVDALYLRFYLLEHSGRALELSAALSHAADELAGLRTKDASLGAQAARVAEALGRMAYQQGHYQEAAERWLHALDLAEEVRDARVGVAARIGVGQVHYARGDWAGGLRFHRDAAHQLKPLGDDYLSAKLALNLGVGYLESGQVEAAERQFSHGLAAARRGQHREFEAEGHWHLAQTALARGQLALAAIDCRIALDISSKLRHHWLEGAASRTWTDIALARGDEASAIRSTRHALSLAERIRSKPQQRQAHRQLAMLLERQHDLQGALAHLWKSVALQDELESLAQTVAPSESPLPPAIRGAAPDGQPSAR
jgi:tetratricopeptide (TPR) repeat protein